MGGNAQTCATWHTTGATKLGALAMIEYAIAGGLMGGIGVLLAAALAYADKKLYVFEDPRIDQVDSMLPHANCGACGCPGCRVFAEKLVAGELKPGKCTVSSPEAIQQIAAFLQVEAGAEEKRVARLACAGGVHVARNRARYWGVETCRAAALVSGGGKACSWGCLGLGDCERVCEFHAIAMDPHGLPVVSEPLCTACGDCVEICPKSLFSIHPVSHRLWVACRNLLPGDEAEARCDVACTACGRCAVDATQAGAPGLIRIENQLAVIDYSKNNQATRAPIERCPTGAIVWIDPVAGPQRGIDAKKITRRSPLPVDATDLPISESARHS
jgi:Na+-translocating ferredoxin:NAD+ oxidoreductase RNF subunit RnfB